MFCCSLSTLQEPRTYKQVATTNQAWVEAMKQELLALKHNDIWEVTLLPPGKMAIECKWVYKLKLWDNSTMDDYTAPIIGNGCTQVEGIAYVESFSPVVCWLFWFYVDDVLVAGPSVVVITQVKQYLDALFTIKVLGVTRYFLGLQITPSDAGISLTQAKYIHDILDNTRMTSAKSAMTPQPQGPKLCADVGALLSYPEPYHRLVGHLIYFNFTRPDVSHGVQQLS
ncbi:UNVERIFIED_CONTAM: hypothetical protein Sradi_2354700 [Sesamum radiatum]|uniref:Reverse transcriptase Ty1/copia-type domain-containing protein n=1 Tax=Sesamum radiatum TaxID=300843 RepID=A0AAW2T6P5_SESRA